MKPAAYLPAPWRHELLLIGLLLTRLSRAYDLEPLGLWPRAHGLQGPRPIICGLGPIAFGPTLAIYGLWPMA